MVFGVKSQIVFQQVGNLIIILFVGCFPHFFCTGNQKPAGNNLKAKGGLGSPLILGAPNIEGVA